MPNRNAEDDANARTAGMTLFESRLINLLALLLVKGLPQGEQIALLDRAGLRPSEIAEMLGTTANTVSVELSNRRKNKKLGRGSSVKKARKSS